jgi:hypothetical protein
MRNVQNFGRITKRKSTRRKSKTWVEAETEDYFYRASSEVIDGNNVAQVSASGEETVESCEWIVDPSGTITGGKILDWLRN